MIKFFRRIRQQSLSENRTTKYLLYAIGEIVLVVIGILLALQVNNWNEKRKEIAVLNSVLLEIHQNLSVDLNILDETIENAQNKINNLKNVEENGSEMHLDTLLHKITIAHRIVNWIPITSGYDKLLSLGLENNLKDSLKIYIPWGYTMFKKSTKSSMAENLTLYSLDMYRNYLIKHGYPLGPGDRNYLGPPKNKKILRHIIKDVEFIGVLRNYQQTTAIQKRGLYNTKGQITFLSNKIEEYLNRQGIKTNVNPND